MTDDPRFAKVYSDPRFLVAPKKAMKVKLDQRFKGMLKDKEFNVVAKVDKYGRKITKKDKFATQNYESDSDSEENSASDSSSSEEKPSKPEPPKKKKQEALEAVGSKYYDEDGKFKWQGESSDQESSEAEVEDDEEYSDAISGIWSVDSQPEAPIQE